MYANYSVQVNCDDHTSPEKDLECCKSTCESVEVVDRKVSKQSDEQSLCRNIGEYALLKIDSFPSNVNINANFTHSDYQRDKSLTKGRKEKEPLTYIINNTCKNKLTNRVNNRIRKLIGEKLTSTEMNDKATYCRPVIDLYNEQFVFKTMERNARLKHLVKKMAVARQREKENVTWNNFINMLKNKHAVSDSNYLGEINDSYKTKLSPTNNRSGLCAELLQKFYDHNYIQNKQLNDNNDELISRKYNLFKYGEDLICYPTSSQARLLMLGRQQQKQYRSNWGDHVSDRNLYNKNGFTNNNKLNFNLNVRKTSSAQTNIKLFKNFTQNKNKDKATNIVEESSRICLNNKQIENDKNVNKAYIQKVGDKLATLIESINTFIEEIKINKKSIKENDLISNICSCKADKSLKSKDATILTDVEKVNQRTEANKSEIMFHKLYQIQKNDDIMKKVPENSCQIEFEEPTRDCSTELTKSFVNDPPIANDQNIKKINTNRQDNPIFQQITIAVNTDPLSFLALLRLSTETVKSVLSSLPILNHCPYLLSLPVGRYIESEQHRYICSVCGTGFDSPSTLSDHIYEHNLGNTRDCCVCRYVLDNVQRTVSLFRCKYCGKCFTRAYCFELHQNACAKGKGQDQYESSDLLVLR